MFIKDLKPGKVYVWYGFLFLVLDIEPLPIGSDVIFMKMLWLNKKPKGTVERNSYGYYVDYNNVKEYKTIDAENNSDNKEVI